MTVGHLLDAGTPSRTLCGEARTGAVLAAHGDGREVCRRCYAERVKRCAENPPLEKDPACPKCGGVKGYFFFIDMRHEMNGPWGKPYESGGDKVTRRPKKAKCIECRKLVPIADACGDEAER